MNRLIKSLLTVISALVLFTNSDVIASDLNLDICRFKGDAESTFLELYIELPRHALTHHSNGENWSGSVLFSVGIFSDSLLLAQDKWKIEDVIENPSDIDSLQKIVDVRIFKLPEGEFNITVSAHDSISGFNWNESVNFQIVGFPSDEVTVSDIEIANYMIPEGMLNKYDRDGFGLIPSPNLIFGKSRPYFFYYVEIYPPFAGDLSYDFIVNRYVLDGYKREVLKLEESEFKDKSQPFADVDSISLADLKSGSYSLHLEITSQYGDTTKQSKKFYIFRPDLDTLDVALLNPALRFQLRDLDSLDVEADLEQIKIFLKGKQYKRALRMSIPEKAQFIHEFWLRYDDDPSTPDNPVRDDYLNRVQQAEERWTTSRLEGYKTDRGRIFVLHGEPDFKEDHSLEISTKPYEIWQYDVLEGGVEFIFVDRNGQGEYTLEHSTMTGEVYNPNWYEDYVQRSGPNPRR